MGFSNAFEILTDCETINFIGTWPRLYMKKLRRLLGSSWLRDWRGVMNLLNALFLQG